MPGQFDIIYFFNVFYAIPDRKATLESLHKIAKENAQLVVFDYINMTLGKNMSDLSDASQYFINLTRRRSIDLEDFSNLAKQAGWKITKIKNLDQEYIKWYRELLVKIEKNRDEIKSLFGKDELALVEKTYNEIYSSLLEKNMGGAIVYAIKV